jgi:hypothetical protein
MQMRTSPGAPSRIYGFDCLPLLVAEKLLDFRLTIDQYFNPTKRYIS